MAHPPGGQAEGGPGLGDRLDHRGARAFHQRKPAGAAGGNGSSLKAAHFITRQDFRHLPPKKFTFRTINVPAAQIIIAVPGIPGRDACAKS